MILSHFWFWGKYWAWKIRESLKKVCPGNFLARKCLMFNCTGRFMVFIIYFYCILVVWRLEILMILSVSFLDCFINWHWITHANCPAHFFPHNSKTIIFMIMIEVSEITLPLVCVILTNSPGVRLDSFVYYLFNLALEGLLLRSVKYSISIPTTTVILIHIDFVCPRYLSRILCISGLSCCLNILLPYSLVFIKVLEHACLPILC